MSEVFEFFYGFLLFIDVLAFFGMLSFLLVFMMKEYKKKRKP